MALFSNRKDAGEQLAEKLSAYANRADTLVLALQRSGVPIAFEITRRLKAPLDIFLIQKLPVPGQKDLSMGAISALGIQILNHDVLNQFNISESSLLSIISREKEELLRRESHYRGDRRPPDIRDRTVIIVDDGLTDSASMAVAAVAIRHEEPHKIIIAVPIASQAACSELEASVDEIVCLHKEQDIRSVEEWYSDFPDVSDDDVRKFLDLTQQAEQ